MSACRPSETRRSARTLGRSRCEKTACCISAGRSSKTSATDIARRPAGARAGVRACRPRRGVSGHLMRQGLMQQYPSHRNHMCMTYLNYTSVTKYCTVPEVASCAEDCRGRGCVALSPTTLPPPPLSLTTQSRPGRAWAPVPEMVHAQHACAREASTPEVPLIIVHPHAPQPVDGEGAGQTRNQLLVGG